MAQVITMPKLSDTMEEGGVAEWFKKEGEMVAEGDLLLSIETDKATMEYASPEEGVLLKILVPPGKAVPLQTPIAIVGKKGEAIDNILSSSQTASKIQSNERVETKDTATSTPKTLQEVAPATSERLKASPLAKKMAQAKGISLANIQGSGPGGRVVANDLKQQAKTTTLAAAPQAKELANRGDEKVAVSMMRKTIAKRLLASTNQVPHFYLTTSANMTKALEFKDALNKEGKANGLELRFSVNDVVSLCVAKALKHHPLINSSWHDDYYVLHKAIHLSIAVALPEGLITPVVFDADMLSIRELASQIRSLAKKAKEGTLEPAQYQGGTFTISNLGMTLVDEFTAIINPPQSCILAVGRTVNQPVADEEGRLAVAPVMKMTLSCDHRIVDGMVGARFLETLVGYLENPLRML